MQGSTWYSQNIVSVFGSDLHTSCNHTGLSHFI